MIPVAAVDDRAGIAFNGRRQSQDRVMRKKLLSLVSNSTLWMNSYSAKLFSRDGDLPENIKTDELFAEKAGQGEYCFIENISAARYEESAEKIILFKWNRKYPGDMYFDIDLSRWRLVSSEEFPGSSHEKITLEVYER